MIKGKEADNGVLKRFMEEFFPFEELCDIGFFTKEMEGDYEAQAERVCEFFGFSTVYEYGSQDMVAHLSYSGERPEHDKEFLTVIRNIYES